METITDVRPERPKGRKTVALGAILVLLAGGGFWTYRRMAGHAGHDESAGGIFYCPMHTNYKADKPGNCPICSMKLVPLKAAPTAAGPAMTMAGGKDVPPEPSPATTAVLSSGGTAPSIRISPERQQQIGVKFAEAALAPAEVEIRAVAKVAYDETQIAHVHTKVSGWIEDTHWLKTPSISPSTR